MDLALRSVVPLAMFSTDLNHCGLHLHMWAGTSFGCNDCSWQKPRFASKPTRNNEILSKIFHQIQKTDRATEKSLTRNGRQLSKLYLFNWSQAGRSFPPFVSLVPLELENVEQSRRGIKTPALVHLREAVKNEILSAQIWSLEMSWFLILLSFCWF